MVLSPLVFLHSRSMHSGLLFSMPMTHFGMPVYCSTALMPRMISSLQFSISCVSLVSHTSHSEALISRVSTCCLGCSLTSVGKPAPPRPTRPHSRTAARKLALSVTSGALTAGSTVCLPSVLMTTESHMRPLDRRKGSTAATVPETLEWIFAETKAARLTDLGANEHFVALFDQSFGGSADVLAHQDAYLRGQRHRNGLLAAVALSCGVCAPSAARFSLFNMELNPPFCLNCRPHAHAGALVQGQQLLNSILYHFGVGSQRQRHKNDVIFLNFLFIFSWLYTTNHRIFLPVSGVCLCMRIMLY